MSTKLVLSSCVGKRVAVVAGAMVGLALLVSGCSAAAHNEAKSSASFVLPAKNLDAWTLPVDVFTMSQGLQSEANDADNVLVSQCVAKRTGYKYYPAVSDYKAKPADTLDSTGTRQVFNPVVATKWGYRNGSSNDKNRAAEQAFDRELNSLPERVAKQLDKCADEMSHKSDVGSYDSTLANLAQSWYLEAQSQANSSKSVKAAAAKWRTCMLPQGVSGLPDSPVEMPTDDIRQQLQGSDSSSGRSGSAPTAEEIKVAVADANCRRSSGWDQAMYSAQWSLLLARMQKQSSQVEQASSMIAKVQQSADKILAAYHPKS